MNDPFLTPLPLFILRRLRGHEGRSIPYIFTTLITVVVALRHLRVAERARLHHNSSCWPIWQDFPNKDSWQSETMYITFAPPGHATSEGENLPRLLGLGGVYFYLYYLKVLARLERLPSIWLSGYLAWRAYSASPRSSPVHPALALARAAQHSPVANHGFHRLHLASVEAGFRGDTSSPPAGFGPQV